MLVNTSEANCLCLEEMLFHLAAIHPAEISMIWVIVASDRAQRNPRINKIRNSLYQLAQIHILGKFSRILKSKEKYENYANLPQRMPLSAMSIS